MPARSTPRTPRVALLVETSSGYGRGLLRGIMRYVRAQGGWSVFLEQRDLTTAPPEWLRDWTGDGVISRSMTPWLPELLSRNGVPLVNLVDRSVLTLAPSVCSDQEEIGRLAAEHLIERGFQQYGFCGFRGEAWSEGRRAGFQDRLAGRGFTAHVYESAWHAPQLRAWDVEQRALTDWVRSLPKPCGVMACNDLRGQQLLDACQLCDLSIPEEVAVIGVDNDELLCQLCNPPLSSVIPDTGQIGYLAAELLARMMAGDLIRQEAIRVPPLAVATRESSDSMAIADPQIALAVRYIREHACLGTTVDDVLWQVPLSRSALERGFRKHLQRSPQQEIRNVQLRRCRHLLRETELRMDRIAELCGFRHPEYMHVVFRRVYGITPGEFRRAGSIEKPLRPRA